MVLGFLVVLCAFATLAALGGMWRGGHRLAALVSLAGVVGFLALLPRLAALFAQ